MPDLRFVLGPFAVAALSSALVLACDGGGPTAVLPPGPTGGYLALSVGFHHGCGIRADGTYCWGTNVAGELGDGMERTSLRPVRVAGGAGFQEIRLGPGHSCGRTAGGNAFCW